MDALYSIKIEEHICQIEKILKQLSNARMTEKSNIWSFFNETIDDLGQVFATGRLLVVCEAKRATKAVQNPATVSGLWSRFWLWSVIDALFQILQSCFLMKQEAVGKRVLVF